MKIFDEYIVFYFQIFYIRSIFIAFYILKLEKIWHCLQTHPRFKQIKHSYSYKQATLSDIRLVEMYSTRVTYKDNTIHTKLSKYA